MTEQTARDRALAMMVAIRIDDWTAEQGCPAWVESADRTCGRPPAEGMLCKRHHTVASRRWSRERQRREDAARDAALNRARMIPEWKAELARVERAIENVNRPVVQDRAAVGGVVHPSIRKRQRAALSDAKVRHLAALHRRRADLVQKIGAAT